MRNELRKTGVRSQKAPTPTQHSGRMLSPGGWGTYYVLKVNVGMRKYPAASACWGECLDAYHSTTQTLGSEETNIPQV